MLAAQTFSEFVKDVDADTFSRNFVHKLTAAGVGCLAAEAKQQSCDAGALGAAVGEMIGDYLVDDPNALTDAQRQEIINIGKLTAGSVALLAGVDVDTAAHAGELAVENNSIQQMKSTFPSEDFEDPDFARKDLEWIQGLPQQIAGVHNYYNDMTIINAVLGMPGITIVINNKNGNMYVSEVADVGINVNQKTLADAIKLAENGKAVRPVGMGASINFGSIKGGEMTAEKIDRVIEGSSVGFQACDGICGGVIRTKNKDTVFTYGVGTPQVGMAGGKMRKVSAQEKAKILQILHID